MSTSGAGTRAWNLIDEEMRISPLRCSIEFSAVSFANRNQAKD